MIVIISIFANVHNTNADDDRNDHRRRRGNSNQSQLRHYRGDKGNEFTGQATAWIFAAANISVAISLMLKGVIQFASIEKGTKERINNFKRNQKKYFRYFHYFLNPLAIIFAFIHLSLSSCRSSTLPEWGLAASVTLVLIGLSIKFKVSPKSIRKVVYKIHTNPVPFGVVIIILLIGHSIID